jgi:hypothetical protein
VVLLDLVVEDREVDGARVARTAPAGVTGSPERRRADRRRRQLEQAVGALDRRRRDRPHVSAAGEAGERPGRDDGGQRVADR